LRMKLHLDDFLDVALEGRQLALCGHIPDLDAHTRVGTGNRQTLAVGMPPDDLPSDRTHRNTGDELPGGRIVDGSEARLLVADGQPAVVWMKCELVRVPAVGQRPAGFFLAGRKVEPQDPTLLPDRQLAVVGAESPRLGSLRFLA